MFKDERTECIHIPENSGKLVGVPLSTLARKALISSSASRSGEPDLVEERVRALVLPNWCMPPIMAQIDCSGVYGSCITKLSAHVLYKLGNRNITTQHLLHSVEILEVH